LLIIRSMDQTLVGRRRQAAERREQLMDTALAVFAAKGFQGAPLR
jgi:AcrR family transcriptional regulator